MRRSVLNNVRTLQYASAPARENPHTRPYNRNMGGQGSTPQQSRVDSRGADNNILTFARALDSSHRRAGNGTSNVRRTKK